MYLRKLSCFIGVRLGLRLEDSKLKFGLELAVIGLHTSPVISYSAFRTVYQHQPLVVVVIMMIMMMITMIINNH